ncbi:MAG: radical SAM protein [Methanohalobium sp.]|uniref:radical SAM protein n=1 Tax=Methanohalobium sp. TaxID=2837493 RepID=UPI003978BB31
MTEIESSYKKQTDNMARIIETGFENLVIRKLLKFATKRNGNERCLDKILKSYDLNDDVNLSLGDKLTEKIVIKIVDSVVSRTSITEEDVKSNLQIDYWRRGLVSTLEGIAWRGLEKPFTSYASFMVVWNFKNACNLKCKHCYQISGNKPTTNDLTTEEKLKAVDEMAYAGGAYISLSGGNRFLQRMFIRWKKIVDKYMCFAIATNGTMLTKENAQKLKDSGCCYAQISLDGNRETHDEFRGMPGAFDKTVQESKIL